MKSHCDISFGVLIVQNLEEIQEHLLSLQGPLLHSQHFSCSFCIRWRNPRASLSLVFLTSWFIGFFFSVVWVSHHGLLPQVQPDTDVSAQFSNDREWHQFGAQVEGAGRHPQAAESALLHPKEAPHWTQLWFQLGLLSPFIRQTFLHVRSAGTTDEGGLAALGICFPLQSSRFKITCLYCWSVNVLPPASMGIAMPEKQMRQSSTLPPFSLFF